VRVAAIHHAGRRLAGDPALRGRLLGLLDDADALVARYAAMTLAQAGQREGLEALLGALPSAQGADRAALLSCLRGCTAFPFAALLDGLLPLEELPRVQDRSVRNLLRGLVGLGAERFAAAARADPAWADNLLGQLARLDGAGPSLREGAFGDRAVVLALPREGEPGFLCCQARRLFLQFREEATLEPERLLRGGEVVFVARKDDAAGAVRLLYALEGRLGRSTSRRSC
jgi:hypothetical protein